MCTCKNSTENSTARWPRAILSMALALPILMAGSLRAEEKPAGKETRAAKNRARSGDNSGKRSEMRKRMIEKFDADGDGQLSEDERAEMRKFMQERRGKQGEKGAGKKGARDRKGPDGRGKAGKGRRGPRGPGGGSGPPDLDKLFKNFDKDGDGKLDRQEFGNALRTMHEKRMEGRRGGGKGRDGARPRRSEG